MAIEINPRLAQLLAERFPSVTVCAESVVRVAELCREHGIDRVDAVICGLPWANFSEADQQAFLSAMLGVLRPQGYFASFAYLQGMLLPAAWRFRRTLHGVFNRVDTSSTVWRNIPPAFVYQCRTA
jgi:phospholipid N-methyltransferase